jgi:hypothetical protein
MAVEAPHRAKAEVCKDKRSGSRQDFRPWLISLEKTEILGEFRYLEILILATFELKPKSAMLC